MGLRSSGRNAITDSNYQQSSRVWCNTIAVELYRFVDNYECVTRHMFVHDKVMFCAGFVRETV